MTSRDIDEPGPNASSQGAEPWAGVHPVVREEDGRPFDALGARVLRLVHPLTVGSAQLGVSLCLMEPREAVRVHRHDYEESYFVLAGSGVMELEGEDDIRLEPGVCVYVHPGRYHGQVNDGQEQLRILCSLSPPPVEGVAPDFRQESDHAA